MGCHEDLPIEVPEDEALIAGMLQDMAKRLIAAENIVLMVAKLEISSGGFFTDSIILPLVKEAREYVAKAMLYQVGIKKLVKSWEDK